MAVRDRRARLPAVGLFDLFLVYLVWGSTFLAMRVGVRPGSGVGPWWFGGTRVLVAGVLLVLVAWLARRRLRVPRAEWGPLVAAGILIWVGGHGLLLVAETQADSGYTALFIASFPLWAALYDALLDRRAPSGRTVAALVVGLAGIGLLSYPNMGGGGLPAGIMLALFAAPIAWAAGFTLQRRRVREAGTFIGTAVQHLGAVPVFFVVALVVREPVPAPATDAALAWVYLVVFGSIAAYTAAVHAQRVLPARIAETYAYVNPVVALALGHLLLDEPVASLSVVGAALVLLGVWGVFQAERPARP